MSEDKKTSLPVHVKQDTITPANKRIMAYTLIAVIMLCGAIIVTSFKM